MVSVQAARPLSDVLSALGLPPREFDLSAGCLCLDFVNTVSGSRAATTTERLTSYADLLSWAYQAELVTDDEVRRLLRDSSTSPIAAGEVLARGLRLREAMFRLVAALPWSRRPSREDLDALNLELASALSHSRLSLNHDAFDWSWADDVALDRMLWPLARSAADLLTDPEALVLARECESDTCDWLFLDTTKNHSRRWCDMKSCGNRAKARRHYQRRKQTGEG